MAIKYICDRCGKEVKRLYTIAVYDTDRASLFDKVLSKREGLCKKCFKEVLKDIKKALKE